MSGRSRHRLHVLALVSAGLALTVACGPSSSDGQGGRTVVVYSSADKEFAEIIFKAYETRSGVRVLPVYDTEETKTAGLTARLIAERDHPRADVFWSSDTSRAVAIAAQGIAEPYVPTGATGIPDSYRHPGGLWTGFGARIRVLMYNANRVSAAEAPQSIRDLTQPRWKGRVAIANPHFGTMSFHAAALFTTWGEPQARTFFEALKANGVVLAAGNADVRDRVADGRVDVGLMDEDDAIVALRDGKPVSLVVPDQLGDAPLGTPLMPNAAMLIKGAPNAVAGKAFLDFLISAESERLLAASAAAQYPLHPGEAGPNLLPPLQTLKVMSVDYSAVAAMLPTMDAALKDILGL